MQDSLSELFQGHIKVPPTSMVGYPPSHPKRGGIAGRVGACLASGGKSFQRAGATAEKTLFLNPTNQQSLMDRVRNMPSLPDRVGQVDKTGVRRSLR